QFRKVEVKELKPASAAQPVPPLPKGGQRETAPGQPPSAGNVDDIKAALANRLKHADAWTRIDAAEALWKIDNDPAAVAAMVADLKDRDWQVRRNAAYTLGRFGSRAKAAVPALTEALQDASICVSNSAALALWQL